MKKSLTVSIIIILLAAAALYFSLHKPIPQKIGGDLDQSGCLVGGGYTFSEEIGACVRTFELTPDISKAAKIAVDNVGRSYGLTVVSFNSYEEAGAYDIMLNHGSGTPPETIYIRNWQVAQLDEIEKTNVENYLKANISTLSPVKPVLGGAWYVVTVDTNTSTKTGKVTYEDGHIQEKKSFKYTVDDKAAVTSLEIQ